MALAAGIHKAFAFVNPSALRLSAGQFYAKTDLIHIDNPILEVDP